MAKAESTNVIGALIFFSYIVAALLLSTLIVGDLWWLNYVRNYMREKGSKHVTKLSWINFGISVALSVLSFSVLSYHMLNFLILSYSNWCDARGISVPEAILGARSVVGIGGSRTPLHVWRWATSSTLFQDFAEVICGDPESWLWTQTALLYSYAWNTYMAIEGTFCSGQSHCLILS